MKKSDTVQRKIALIIPAHNEELHLEDTVRSAVDAGQPKEDIYIVDDNSSDLTAHIARLVLPPNRVMSVSRSGKALAIWKIINFYGLRKRYEWIHIADADTVFGDGYFNILRQQLDPRNVAATGYIDSLPGDYVSRYRAYEYTLGMEVHRRIQVWLGTITVIPGPTSCFRSDVMGELDFNTGSFTEDFDVTLQIHRKRLGTIQYIKSARVLTQDPKDIGDFYAQVLRWHRGNFQTMRAYGIGASLTMLDGYLGYQVAQMIIRGYIYAIYLPFMLLLGFYEVAAIALLSDIAYMLIGASWVAVYKKRYDILAAFPIFYILQSVYLFAFLRAAVEVLILRRFPLDQHKATWETSGRRYKIEVR